MPTVKETTQKQGVCIGCGLCAFICPKDAINMHWSKEQKWWPIIDEAKCNECGLCTEVCPQTPKMIAKYAIAAARKGERFGLQDAGYFIAYDLNPENRIRSASGGATNAILKHLLGTGEIDGVIASVPVMAPIGQPHYEMKIIRSMEELEKARSSHYYPLRYDNVFRKISQDKSKYAVTGTPCIFHGLKKLPEHILDKIQFTFCLACGYSVNGQFLDCLAKQEGVRDKEGYTANLRDKFGGIPNGNNYNDYFKLKDRDIRRNRFQTAHTHMWRNYYFARECCFYCADFYGSEADFTVKDAWGRLSNDPLGMSLLVVRNPKLISLLHELKRMEKLHLEPCSEEEVFRSQTITPIFKHIKVRDRLVWKKSIRRELVKDNYPLGATPRFCHKDSWNYFRLKFIMHSAKFIYTHFGHRLISGMVITAKTFNTLKKKLRKYAFTPFQRLKHIRDSYACLGKRKKQKYYLNNGNLRVLISGGYGYCNVGDEAQLAANLHHWREAFPSCQLTVFTPNLLYTQSIHPDVRIELAPRISLFGLGNRQYFGSDKLFKRLYFILASLYLFNAYLIRAGLPTFGITLRQTRVLDEIKNSDVLFLSGGGYLTGMTLTRLWDNMLLIRLAHVFDVPVLLSGQTIGVFKDLISRSLAKWGLKKAELIYLRDHSDSPRALSSIGIQAKKIRSTFDDALFFQAAPSEKIADFLKKNSIDSNKSYLAVNVHYWGQSVRDSRIIMKKIASSLDAIQEDLGLQIVFVAMHKKDEPAIDEVIGSMKTSGVLLNHDYSPELAVGIIHKASLCLTMKHHPIIFALAGGVPTVSMAFDDYYRHKNRGAQKIFGLEEFVIFGCIEELSKNIYEKIGEIHSQREKLSLQIKARLEELRPEAGEIIYRWRKTTHYPWPSSIDSLTRRYC